MILTTQKHFEDAILRGEEIKHKTVFYTGEEQEKEFKIGDYVKGKGIFIGDVNGENLCISLKESNENLNWNDAVAWCKKQGGRLPKASEWLLVYENKDKINQGLKKYGERKIEGCYWSSTVHNSNGALFVYMTNGNVGYNFKTSTNRQREVCSGFLTI